MKTIKFKNPADQINYGGRIIGSHNINEEIYDELVKVAPGHKDHFIVNEEEEPKKKEAPKAGATV